MTNTARPDTARSTVARALTALFFGSPRPATPERNITTDINVFPTEINLLDPPSTGLFFETTDGAFLEELSVPSSTSSASTSSALLRQELALVQQERQLEAAQRALEISQLQQQLAASQLQNYQNLAEPPIPSSTGPPPVNLQHLHTVGQHTAGLHTANLLTSQFFTTQKTWEPLTAGTDFEVWQDRIISTIQCDPYLHVLYQSKSLVKSTDSVTLDQYLHHKLAPCLQEPTSASFLHRTDLGGKGLALFWTLDSALINRSRAHRQAQLTSFLTTMHRDTVQESVDVYYNRFSHLLHQIQSGPNGIIINPTEVRERFLYTLGGHYTYLSEALEREHLDPFYLSCNDNDLLTRLRNVRPRPSLIRPNLDLVPPLLPPSLKKVSNNQPDAGNKHGGTDKKPAYIADNKVHDDATDTKTEDDYRSHITTLFNA